MARFSNYRANFFDDDLDPIDAAPELVDVVPISVDAEGLVNGAGEASAVFAANGILVGALTGYSVVYCVIFYDDANRGSVDLPLCEPFRVTAIVMGPNSGEVTMSGPSLLTDLQRYTIYRPIGASAVTNTTVLSGSPADAPTTTRTVAVGAPAGNDAIKLDSKTGGDVGDEIRIELDNGNWHVTVVTAKEPGGMANTFQFQNKMPSAASIGNAVHFRTRQIRVATAAAAAAFKTGVECRVTMDGGAGTFTTLIAEAPGGTNGDTITLRDGLTAGAAAGNAVQATDLSGKSTTDVTQILAVHGEWTAEFQTGTGTAAGTRYQGGGDTVYDILRSIAAETGEFFRLLPASNDSPKTGAPERVIQWRRTHDTAGTGGGTLRLVQSAQAGVDADALNDDRAILIDKPVPTRDYDPVTQIIPVAGDARVTLFSCSDAAVTAATSAGYTVFTTGLGLYAPPYVQYDAAHTAIGIWQRRVVFSEVTVESDNVTSIQEAADKLLKLAIAFLQDHSTTYYTWDTGRFVSPVTVLPGQTIRMAYDAPDGTGSWVSTDPLYVESVKVELRPDGEYAGVPLFSVKATNRASYHSAGGKGTRSQGRAIGQLLKTADRMAAKGGTPSSVFLSISAPGGDDDNPKFATTDNSVTNPATILTTNSTGRLTLAEVVVGEEDAALPREVYPMEVRSTARFHKELIANGGVTLTEKDAGSSAVLERVEIAGKIRLVGRDRDSVYQD